MNKTSRLTVLGLVFVLSMLFFWQAINTYLLPSKAQLAPNMKIFISEKAIQCNDTVGALCLVHIFGSTDPTLGVGGVTGALSFSENLSLAGITQEGFCGQSAFKLEIPLKYSPVTGGLMFSIGTLRGDSLLVGGTKCITTVGFRRVPATANGAPATDAKVALAESARWQAVGTQSIVPDVDVAPVPITFNPGAPIPSITITPPVIGGPVVPPVTPPTGSCVRKGEGDCTCDGKINVLDWEVLRSSMRSEGGSCDVNGDGIINSVDLSIWKKNHD